jgi:nucleoprotein TPR
LSSTHNQASSSNTVTTSQAGGHKRPRDVEGDSSTGQSEEQSDKPQPQKKRTRVQDGVSESGLDVEYQVPTSSQRDQEDDIIVVDSEEDDEEEDEMDADDGNNEVNEADEMDDADNGENYEMDGSYEQDQDMVQYDEGGPDIDENDDEEDEDINNANNEVDVDDDSEVPNQSSGATPTAGAVQQVAPIATTTTSTTSTSAGDGGSSSTAEESSATEQQHSISSGSEAAGSSTPNTPTSQTWRQVAPLSRQQQAAHLLIMQQQGYEDAEDRIVPSTPTLFAPRLAASPHPAQVPHAARFTFNESTTSTSTRNAIVPSGGGLEGMDDTRVDLSSQLDEANDAAISTGRSVPSTPQPATAPQDLTAPTTTATVDDVAADAEAAPEQSGSGEQPEAQLESSEETPSHSESHVPEISIVAASEDGKQYVNEIRTSCLV